jgi:hypothetical protein
MRRIQRHLEWVMAKYPAIEPELLNHQLMRDDTFWINLVRSEKLLDVAEKFLGEDCLVFVLILVGLEYGLVLGFVSV